MQLTILFCACMALATAEIYVNKFPYVKTNLSYNDHINVSPRIVNGEEVKPHSIPYQVWLSVKAPHQSQKCGGILISKNFVLTAGHCGLNALTVSVLLGAHNITMEEPTQVVVQGKTVKMHEEYKLYENDIALIELETPVTFNENIRPVKLPSRKDVSKTYAGERARVSGWGRMKGDAQFVSTVLNAEENEVLTNSVCQSSLPDKNIGDGIVCLSTEGNKSACSGDSGGPLTTVDDETLIGIVSFGVLGCLPEYPNAFTRVTHYLEWIEQNSDIVLV